MKTDKKQILVISNQAGLINSLKEELSLQFDISTVNSVHSGFQSALILLPDIILLDQTSLSLKSFKNLANFKSTHFLNKSWLIMYANEAVKPEMENSYGDIVNEIFYTSISHIKLCEKVIQHINAKIPLSNYWKDSFMGLFNLLENPIVLLHQESIVEMNDAFKQTFKIHKTEGLKLTDFVDCENKVKVKASLRNFARGKHMKAVTNTVLRLKNNKVRNAKISFSKLDKMIDGQFIMIIHFTEDKILVKEKIGTHSTNVEKCFMENSHLTDFSFTRREKEIIGLLCKGYKTKEISDTLFISPKTIEKHRANIIKRTNSETILESIIYAINHNLIDLRH
ncbi:MAG: helix-turn-helix transcriptional regulator [Gillisia sp.]|nr:helix-turn-helix transcriptional regulator [Gillisia sp.]